MTDKISESIVSLTKRIDNIESQRSLVNNIVDRFMIEFDYVPESDEVVMTTHLFAPSTTGDSLIPTDTLLSPELGVDFTDTVITIGNHQEAGYMRLDYGRLDYDRLSHYQGGANNEVILTIS